MDYPEKENIERRLRKKHKNWTDDKIQAEALRIWEQYRQINKEQLDKREKSEKEAFEKTIDTEFLNALLDGDDND